jgi:hypothetical protein
LKGENLRSPKCKLENREGDEDRNRKGKTLFPFFKLFFLYLSFSVCWYCRAKGKIQTKEFKSIFQSLFEIPLFD